MSIMVNIGSNFNTTNMLGLLQMFSGNSYGMNSMGFGSIFNSIGCTSTTYGSTKNGTGSMIGALVAGLALNYAPQILGNFIGGISSAVQASRAQNAEIAGTETEADVKTDVEAGTIVRQEEKVENTSDTVKRLIGEENFNKLSDSLKQDVQKKYDVLKNVRQLDDTQLAERLDIYIKAMTEGEKRNQVKEFVTQVLTEAKIPSEKQALCIEAIIDKHNLIELFDPSSNNEQKTTLRNRIIAYANGLEYGAGELNLALKNGQTYVNDAIKDAIDNNDIEAYKKAHLQWGKDVVELYDSINPNGVINFEEFAEYQTQLAIMGGVNNLSEDPELANALIQLDFDILDKDHNGYIDIKEMATDLYATSKIQDKKNETATSYDITQDEYNDAFLAKQAWGKLLLNSNVTSIEEFNKLPEEKRKEAYNQLTIEEQNCWDYYNYAYLTGRQNLFK